MASVYSARLYIAHALSTDTITVPEDELWVVRTALVFWPGVSPGPLFQMVDKETDATILWLSPGPGANGVASIIEDMRLVLPTGKVTQLLTGDSPDVILNGYILSLP